MVSTCPRAALFPLSDHFPLAKHHLLTENEPNPQAGVEIPSRPFGLRHATTPNAYSTTSALVVEYDEKQQIGLIYRDNHTPTPFTTFDAPMTIESTGEVGRPTYDEIHDYDH